MRSKLADVERGQAALMGTIREADTPTIFVLRLKVANRQITEIETLVIRNQMAAERSRIGWGSLGAPGTKPCQWPTGCRAPSSYALPTCTSRGSS